MKLSETEISIFMKIISNYNSLLNNKLPHYDYCTDITKDYNPYWEMNCLETASHILLECGYFSSLRNDNDNDKIIIWNQLQSINSI